MNEDIHDDRIPFPRIEESVFDPYYENVVAPFFQKLADEEYEARQAYAD